MNTQITTNRINYEINKDTFVNNYDVFKISTSSSFFRNGAFIVDIPLLNNNICSVLFENGKELYVLMRKNIANLNEIKNSILGSSDSEFTTISQPSIETIHEAIILQLLLNSLSTYESDLLKFNNLTGRFYSFHPKWLKKGTYNNKKVVFKIPCLEIKITKDFLLRLNVRTFTSILLKNHITFNKKKFEDYPQYVFSASNTLRRKLQTDEENSFILRQTKNNKTSIKFLDIKNIDSYNESKMGVVANVIEHFNEKFSDVAHISFSSLETYQSIDITGTMLKENEQIIQSQLSKYPINIVDCVNEEDSIELCEQLKFILFQKYGVSAKISNAVSKDALNIRLIHEAAYYKTGEDPYQSFENIATQHITVEEFSQDNQSVISAIIQGVLIKEDLTNKKISLFDWSKLQLSGDILFGIEFKIQEKEKYLFMKIHPDATFEFYEQEADLFDENEFCQLINVFQDAKIKFEDIKGLIKDENGDINTIKDTDWFTIPEIFEIKRELSSGNTNIRGVEMRNKLYSSCLDIKMFKIDDAFYYFVGTIGYGLRVSMQNASIIRKLETYNNSSYIFDKFLPTMNVKFVRNGQLTIIPFPFKYMREYVDLKYYKEKRQPK